MRSDDASTTMRDRLHSGKATDQQARSPLQLFNARAVADVRVEIISAAEHESTGVAEALLGPPAAAISNATANTLGVRMRTLPITRECVIEALM